MDYPVNLLVENKQCLVVGGCEVATQKTKELLSCGAEVKVVALEISNEMRELVTGKPAASNPETSNTASLSLHEREYRAEDIEGCMIAISATGDPAVNNRVLADGRKAGVLVNSADDPENCDFTLPARMRQGDLLITISTAGKSPAFASWIRRQLEATFGADTQTLLEVVAEVRQEAKAQNISTESLDWQTALNSLNQQGLLDTATQKEKLRDSLGLPNQPNPNHTAK